jgi:hypothetical protein
VFYKAVDVQDYDQAEAGVDEVAGGGSNAANVLLTVIDYKDHLQCSIWNGILGNRTNGEL